MKSTTVIFAIFKLQKLELFFFQIFSTQHLQNNPTSFSHLLKRKPTLKNIRGVLVAASVSLEHQIRGEKEETKEPP